MRKIHELDVSEKSLVLGIILPFLGAIWFFMSYEIPAEKIVSLVKILFILFSFLAVFKILDLFVFNEKNRKKKVSKNNAKKK